MQRSLKFVRYLHEYGWNPVVLSASPRAYSKTNDSQLTEIPDGVPVHRAFGLDARRHFAIGGRYPGFLAWPDQFVSWWPAAVIAGRRLIRRHRPCAIWSTFPINTANLVALHLAGWSRLPWIADLRDPITLDGYPPEPVRFRLARSIERRTVTKASRVVFTAKRTLDTYVARYPWLAEKAVLIPNGYDESNFPSSLPAGSKESAKMTLLHSGALQLRGRNPQCFFEALAKLKARGQVSIERLRVVFRGSGFDDVYRKMAIDHGVSDLVAIEGHLPYEAAIQEMVEADALLILQGSAYNQAVPAKLYEYLYARKPVLGLIDRDGETQRVLQEVGITETADIDDPSDIAACLLKLLESRGTDCRFRARESEVEKYSRRSQTLVLSGLLDQLCTADPRS
jgi:glycosyltransferase involved in cell wall biosynthesis